MCIEQIFQFCVCTEYCEEWAGSMYCINNKHFHFLQKKTTMCEVACYILQNRALTLPIILKCTLIVCVISAFQDQSVKNALYIFVTYL